MSRVAVIGAGPAGMAATIQLVRAGIEVQVFEQGRVGGALWNAGWVENYPGFPGGISGHNLAKLMEEQFLGYVDNIISSSAEEIILTEKGFFISGQEFDGVIICTGTRPKKVGFTCEDKLAEAGLLCYGVADYHAWHRVKEACVIGGGEASMDMALSLTEEGIKVTLLHRSEPDGILALKQEAISDEEITWLEGEVKEARIHENKAVLALENEERAFDMVLVAVGREACMPEFNGFDMDDAPAGLLVAGDATRGGLGQVAMAVGDGVDMAMTMDRYLRSKK
ncbi:MAG: NAD(P)/FAD-dependent oxidoreductase [Thermoplasmata archaeon]|nr:NAD(P)/FAD-dependent oxidoreductase [Thermoplasmata archaeon]